MIRLIDLLAEMAVMSATSEVDEVIQAATDMGLDNPVLWRGVGGIKSPVSKIRPYYTKVMRITGDRSAFRGGSSDAKKLIQMIFKKEDIQPVFVKMNRGNVSFFGQPAIVILEKPYTMYQSSKIDDVMVYAKESPNELQSGADTYKPITLKEADPVRELVIDAKNYWALPDQLLKGAKTYKDVVEYIQRLK